MAIQSNELKGKIILRNVYGRTKKVSVEPCANYWGELPEHIRQVDQYGQMIMKPGDDKRPKTALRLIPITKMITLQDYTEFDLDNIERLSEWKAIENSQCIAKEWNAFDHEGKTYTVSNNLDNIPDAEFFIEMPQYEAEQKLNKINDVHTAISHINKAGEEKCRNMCKILELSVSPESSISEIKLRLYELADKSPKSVSDSFTSPDYAMRVVVESAVEKGIIKTRGGFFYYGDDCLLGSTKDSVINSLKSEERKVVWDRIQAEAMPEFFSKK